ncbi:helix-turn-helix transcriptional regulator [Methylobacter sp. Wu8]|uniref:helix-turn-helix domain-containing protein n=1 Tax=Methylobacter sp. Wu8 TaxID=3118457 RepID=UPI002F3050B5
MNTITHKKGSVNKKIPEIERFKQVLKVLGIKTIDISKESGISVRTINNYIWRNTPLGGQLLRYLNEKYKVSIDWVVSGQGFMLLNGVTEPVQVYAVAPDEGKEAKRVMTFFDEFLREASSDEQVWLDMQLKLHIPQYVRFLDRYRER